MPVFTPAAVFDQLYNEVLENGCRRFLAEFADANVSVLDDAAGKKEYELEGRLAQLQLDVKNAFVELAYLVKEGSTTALSSHKNILYQNRRRFANMHTIRTCLACLAQQPSHILRCGHAVCDRCIIVNDEGPFQDCSRHVIKQCPLCFQRVNNDVTIKPATAGVRVGSFDGGGMRALVILKMVGKILTELGIDGLKPHDCFDLIAATSSGKVVSHPEVRALLIQIQAHCVL